MTGTEYTFNDVKIPVEHNVVKFGNFEIKGVNENPLAVNGMVNISNFSDPKVDLKLTANNMMIVNTKRAARGADIYGRGYINLLATVKGDMSFMDVQANVVVASGTNLTYVMTNAETALSATKDNDMVKFVNFADTAAVARADSIVQQGMALRLDASLTIQSGSTINVDLSTNGRNRVSLQPEGNVDFTMPPFGQPRMTGRINIPKGFVRYTPQFMSEKNFSFEVKFIRGIQRRHDESHSQHTRCGCGEGQCDTDRPEFASGELQRTAWHNRYIGTHECGV